MADYYRRDGTPIEGDVLDWAREFETDRILPLVWVRTWRLLKFKSRLGIFKKIRNRLRKTRET